MGPETEDIHYLLLSAGAMVRLDRDDWNSLSRKPWAQVTSRAGHTYAYRREGGRKNGHTIYMHRVIADAPSGMVVDHKNRNGLDNRRCNLRVCTISENHANKVMRKSNTSSRFKGVWRDARDGRWAATVAHEFCGRYIDEIEAAKAYNKRALDKFGAFALLNEV